MTALDIKIFSRKRGKANRPSELEEVLLGYYIKLRPGSQESCVYLGIRQLRRGKRINRNFWNKITFITKLEGMCLHQNLGGERGNSKASKIMPIKESIA